MNANIFPVIVWFRQDLRLKDNPALLAAHESVKPIIPLYILDDVNSGEWRMGGASRWWLHQSLSALNKSLNEELVFDVGDPETILSDIICKTGADKIYWNRCYEPWRIQRDTAIKQSLNNEALEAKSFNGALLFEPHKVLKKDGTAYRVFTPFYKKGCLGRGGETRMPTARPEHLHLQRHKRLSLDKLNLIPDIAWYTGMQKEWQPGEAGAQACLQVFLENGFFQFQFIQLFAQLFLFQIQRVIFGNCQQGFVIDGAFIVDRPHIQFIELNGAIGQLFDKILFDVDVIKHQRISTIFNDVERDNNLIPKKFLSSQISFSHSPTVTLVDVCWSVRNIDMVDANQSFLNIGASS